MQLTILLKNASRQICFKRHGEDLKCQTLGVKQQATPMLGMLGVQQTTASFSRVAAEAGKEVFLHKKQDVVYVQAVLLQRQSRHCVLLRVCLKFAWLLKLTLNLVAWSFIPVPDCMVLT